MKAFVARHKVAASLLLSCGLSLFTCALWALTASIRGTIAARFDVARGIYAVIGYGLPPPGREEYAAILKSRYGVDFRTVAGCTVSLTLVHYADSYDEVSTEAVQRKFGRDIFQESWVEVQSNLREHRQIAENK